ncbi:MAG: response regulator transcription factor [Acidobacteria bacterium]|nr:response regulator transcription factor [Acidobacteriota bacterium]
MKKRVLVVEDDPVLTRVLRDNLTFEGFEVESVSDGSHAQSVARDFGPDLVLLDVNLPGQSGFDLCQAWRERSQVPIILLTAMGQKSDKVRGLQLGADDYVTKPFELEELLARIHAVLRRARPFTTKLVLGDVTVDFGARTAVRGTTELELTHRDFEILQYLAARPHTIVSRDELLRAVWGYHETVATRAVDHAIGRLRKKIEEKPHKPRFIHTVHGDGYYLAPDGRDLQ